MPVSRATGRAGDAQLALADHVREVGVRKAGAEQEVGVEVRVVGVELLAGGWREAHHDVGVVPLGLDVAGRVGASAIELSIFPTTLSS